MNMALDKPGIKTDEHTQITVPGLVLTELKMKRNVATQNSLHAVNIL